MDNFVANNPFPSYDNMIQLIETHQDIELSMSMYAEYGEFNHECLKTIYESGMNRILAREMGQKIYDRGGIEAMQMNYYVFTQYSPFIRATNREIYYNGITCLEYIWDGIGKWQN